MTSFEIVAGVIIIILTLVVFALVSKLDAKRAEAKQVAIAREWEQRQLEYAKEHIKSVAARNRRAMLGVKVVARSNNDDELLIGKIVGFAEITMAKNPVPAILEESTGKTLHTLGIVVPYTDELMKELSSRSYKEQWDWMVSEGLGLRWE